MRQLSILSLAILFHYSGTAVAWCQSEETHITNDVLGDFGPFCPPQTTSEKAAPWEQYRLHRDPKSSSRSKGLPIQNAGGDTTKVLQPLRKNKLTGKWKVKASTKDLDNESAYFIANDRVYRRGEDWNWSFATQPGSALVTWTDDSGSKNMVNVPTSNGSIQLKTTARIVVTFSIEIKMDTSKDIFTGQETITVKKGNRTSETHTYEISGKRVNKW